jgi:hypothetical protein
MPEDPIINLPTYPSFVHTARHKIGTTLATS